MVRIRVAAIVTFGLLAAYYVLRALATQCSGPQCDNYIIPSLLLPVIVLLAAAVTGVLAIAAAAARRQHAWLSLASVATALSVLGPIASAVVFRDNPDSFVPAATVLASLAPLAALVYSFTGRSAPGRP